AVTVPLAIGIRLRLLSGAVHAQRRDGGAVQRDHPGAVRRLGCARGQPAVPALHLPADHRGSCVQVDLAPPQSGRLAAPQPAQRDQVVDGVQPMASDPVEETGLPPGTSHTYRIRATDPFGNTVQSPASTPVQASPATLLGTAAMELDYCDLSPAPTVTTI